MQREERGLAFHPQNWRNGQRTKREGRAARCRADANCARWKRAKADACAIIARIVKHHNPTRIWQWGSVLHPEKFTEISDIDIALEGIGDPAEFFAILGEAEEMTDFPVHIVQLDRLMPEFADIIRMKGRIVHEC